MASGRGQTDREWSPLTRFVSLFRPSLHTGLPRKLTRPNSRICSCSFDSTAKLWDADAGTCLYTFARASDYVYSIAFEPVSGRYVATGSNDGRLDIYRVEV